MAGASTSDNDDLREYIGQRMHVNADDGRSFVGVVTDIDGDRIEVATPTGPEWFSRSEIQEIGPV